MSGYKIDKWMRERKQEKGFIFIFLINILNLTYNLWTERNMNMREAD